MILLKILFLMVYQLMVGFIFPKEIKTLDELIQNIKVIKSRNWVLNNEKLLSNDEIPDKELKKIIDQTIEF